MYEKFNDMNRKRGKKSDGRMKFGKRENPEEITILPMI